MHRIDTPTAQKDKFGAGKNGFTRGNPQTGTPATELDDDYFDAIQEELTGIIEASGAAPDKSKRNQLLVAMKTLHLSRANPFADIKADGPDAVTLALSNLGLGTAAKLSAITGMQGSSGYLIIPSIISGKEKNIIIQWGGFAGSVSGDTPVTFPFPFPNAVRQIIISGQCTGTGAFGGYNAATKTGFNGNWWAAANQRQSGTVGYWAIGD